MQNPERDVEDMGVYEAINHIGWELGAATGLIDPTAEEQDVDWNELLKRAVELIELGHRYEDLADS